MPNDVAATPTSTAPTWRRYALVGSAFMVFAVVWNVVVQIGVGLLSVAIYMAGGGTFDATDPDLASKLVRADVSGVAFFASIGGLALFAFATAAVASFDRRRTFALRMPPLPVIALALMGTFAVPWLPSWVAERLAELFPILDSAGTLKMITDMLTTGPLFGRVLMLLAVTVGAPIFEELIFRGFFWHVAERAMAGLVSAVSSVSPANAAHSGRLFAFVFTSLFFALFHLDPIQSISLIPIAFFLGWIRLVGGSIWPCMLAHLVNNGIAVALTFAFAGVEVEQESISGLVAFGSAGVLVVLCLAVLPARVWRVAER